MLHTLLKTKKIFVKKVKSLEKTKKYFNESKSLTGVELKEFSLIYLVINNLNLIQENIHLIENIKLFTDVNKQIFEKVLLKLKSRTKIIN